MNVAQDNSTPITRQSRIGVLYGGLSSEREVSLVSGRNCYDALLRLGYENAVLLDVDTDIVTQLRVNEIEIAYLALHGRYGEDGCIQGLLELIGMPYTGCGVAASAIAMNKALTKVLLQAAGLPVLPSITITEDRPVSLPFDYPVMVKPLNEGSSIGMSKVDKASELPQAVSTAFQYCREVMIEAYAKGKSLTVGVVEVDGVPQVTPILELRPTQSEWYDLAAKYTEGGTEFILPADLPGTVSQAVQDATRKAYEAVGCRGVSRIDFVTDMQNNFYILEINTSPGMTSLSDLPAQAKAMGISYDQLVEYILKTAC